MKNHEIWYKVSHIYLVFNTIKTFNLNSTVTPKSVFTPPNFTDVTRQGQPLVPNTVVKAKSSSTSSFIFINPYVKTVILM